MHGTLSKFLSMPILLEITSIFDIDTLEMDRGDWEWIFFLINSFKKVCYDDINN